MSFNKKIVIPWLDHGTQVMKSEFYKEAITWVLGSSHGVTNRKNKYLGPGVKPQDDKEEKTYFVIMNNVYIFK